MLRITIPSTEVYDESTNRFFYTKETTLTLEHSLVSLSKWESRWKKPFLTKDDKTIAEIIDYIKCMTLTQNVNPTIYNFLTQENIDRVVAYIGDTMTATWFTEAEPTKQSRAQVTSELIYYWMVALNIPFECQKWHLNRLFTLIRICNIKNQPPKKMSQKQIMEQYARKNAAHRKKLHSKG